MATRELPSRGVAQADFSANHFIVGCCLCLPLAAGGCAELIGLGDTEYAEATLDGSVPLQGPAGSCPLSDEFDDSRSLDCWSTFRQEDVELSWANGDLAIVPAAGSAWYQEQAGFFMYRRVEGNFVAETRVVASSRYDSTKASSRPWAGGGLLAHVPTETLGLDPSYYGTGIGTVAAGRTAVKAEVTVSRATTQTIRPGEAFSARLRLCRVDPSVRVLVAGLDTGDWVEVVTYDQNDRGGRDGGPPSGAVALPNEVFLGLIAYQFLPLAQDLTAQFSYFHVKRGLVDIAECEAPLEPPFD